MEGKAIDYNALGDPQVHMKHHIKVEFGYAKRELHDLRIEAKWNANLDTLGYKLIYMMTKSEFKLNYSLTPMSFAKTFY